MMSPINNVGVELQSQKNPFPFGDSQVYFID